MVLLETILTIDSLLTGVYRKVMYCVEQNHLVYIVSWKNVVVPASDHFVIGNHVVI